MPREPSRYGNKLKSYEFLNLAEHGEKTLIHSRPPTLLEYSGISGAELASGLNIRNIGDLETDFMLKIHSVLAYGSEVMNFLSHRK